MLYCSCGAVLLRLVVADCRLSLLLRFCFLSSSCHNQLMVPCISCEAEPHHAEDCSVAWGQCSHSYHVGGTNETARVLRGGQPLGGNAAPFGTHSRCLSPSLSLCLVATSCSYFQFHCITRWLKTRSTCPLDDEEWDFVMY